VAERPRRKAREPKQELLRGLAAVDEVLRQPALVALAERYPRHVVADAARAVIERLRREILEAKRTVAAQNLTAEMLVPWVTELVQVAMTLTPRAFRSASAPGSSPSSSASTARVCSPSSGGGSSYSSAVRE